MCCRNAWSDCCPLTFSVLAKQQRKEAGKTRMKVMSWLYRKLGKGGRYTSSCANDNYALAKGDHKPVDPRCFHPLWRMDSRRSPESIDFEWNDSDC
jgi:hypothetical protein